MIKRFANALMVGGAALVIAGGTIVGGTAGGASGAATTKMTVAPASQNVAPDAQSFTVNISAENVNNLGAFNFTVQFDNDILEYVGIADGGFLRSTGRQQQCITPARGPNGESAAATANQYGAFNFGCTTLGLTVGNNGIDGPSGNGTLATVTFKPKAAGTADVRLRGFPGDSEMPFEIRPPANAEDNGEQGSTDLSPVEECSQLGDCPDALVMDFDVQNGVVRVTAAGEPAPTGVPATPTQITKQPTPNMQATAQAVLGTPGRTLSGTPEVGTGSGSGSGGRPSGTVAGAGASGGAQQGGAGAPVAGYGPQDDGGNPWPERAGAALALTGIIAVAAGVTVRRRMAS